jgi:alpha-glucoside transport system substrate-binding protein
MPRRRIRPWGGCATLALLLLTGACATKDNNTTTAPGGTDGGGAKVVTIFGPEVKDEADGLQKSFDAFEKQTGIDIQVTGDKSFEEQIGVRVDGGSAPDIAMFPQPGKIRDFAADIVDLPDDVAAKARSNFEAGWLDLVTIDGKIQAVPAKADLKSVVWYSPEAFKTAGYQVPKTLADFTALVDKIEADGKNAFCVGLGSDAATGWPFTDWVEDFMLRLKGPDVYDKWVRHEIPFDDPAVVEVGQYVHDLWAKPGGVYGGLQNAAATPFADAGLPLLKGDCLLHRQGNFYTANWPKGTTFGDDGQVNAFYLPGSTANPNITLSGGIYAAAFHDRPEVRQVLDFIAGTGYSDARAPIGGFLSPNKNADPSKYGTKIEQDFAKVLKAAKPVRFDASDLMPGKVGSGTFWTAAVDITTGAKDVKAAFADVEASWPKS